MKKGDIGDGVHTKGRVDVACRHALLLRKYAQIQNIYPLPLLHSHRLFS
jgi:hypothetical protein